MDKFYLMRKEFNFEQNDLKTIKKNVIDNLKSKLNVDRLDNETYNDVVTFFDTVQYSPEIAKASYPDLWNLYREHAYEITKPTKGRTYRDNKIVDMTLSVLTNSTTADKMLNPGGFDQQKKMGYRVAAFKNPVVREKYSWEDLGSKSISELKDLCYIGKNLCFVDAQVQFYKQNSAAGQILGMFAVQKTAHAVFEGDKVYINIDKVLNSDAPFEVAGIRFNGSIEMDPRDDTNKQLIGKTLGSLVASAADAVKDPVLNLMNINGTTANILNSLVRLGMPFDDAAMILSQQCITGLLAKYNTEKLSKNVKFTDLINERISELEGPKGLNLGHANKVKNEAITRDELIDGLIGGVDDKDLKTEYKVLLAYQKFQNIAKAMKGPTLASRLNSISSAVGPQIVDNLIMDYKIDQFDNGVFTVNGEGITFSNLLRMHPILNAFSQGYGLASELFRDMPISNFKFRECLQALGNDIRDTFMNDRELLLDFSDFYQSYMLVANGAIPTEATSENKSQGLNYYINQFPKDFFAKNKDGKTVQERFPDNVFIKAIRLSTVEDNASEGKFTPVLKIDTTGMDPEEKARLTAGWLDLYRDPNGKRLAEMLFYYNFFRTGIGFSPKSFMSLLPLELKQGLNGYLDTFRHNPSNNMIPNIVMDQFIRNNWDNNKLVPKVKLKEAPLERRDGSFEVALENVNTPYFKADIQGVTKLFRLADSTEDDQNLYVTVEPLGNNGQYLEITANLRPKALTNTTSANEYAPTENLESDSDEKVVLSTEEEMAYILRNIRYGNLLDLISTKRNQYYNNLVSLNSLDEASREAQVNEYEDMLLNYLKVALEDTLGTEISKESIKEVREKYC